MSRFCSLIFYVALGTVLLACASSSNSGGGAGGTSGTGGSTGGTLGTGGTADTGGTSGAGTSTKDPIELVPLDNTVSGWTVDPTIAKITGARAMTATTKKGAVDLIDGAAEPFFKAPSTPKEFLWQNYLNTTLPAAPPPTNGAGIALYIVQMPSADQATSLYQALLSQSEYSGQAGTINDWQPTSPTLGTESRIENTVTAWWINFHQDAFYVEVMLSPSFGPPPDYVTSDPDLKQEAFRFAQAISSAITSKM
ncbi:MAG TPA: hypothetical protein VF518_02690 [Polyangia bacterium]